MCGYRLIQVFWYITAMGDGVQLGLVTWHISVLLLLLRLVCWQHIRALHAQILELHFDLSANQPLPRALCAQTWS